ncbi:MAG: aminoglycoside phosphotransferase family protein [Chloroflexi bacterium]|nr:aminoglycoside phosphotransferase family protein [Chloroflexota bacterium]
MMMSDSPQTLLPILQHVFPDRTDLRVGALRPLESRREQVNAFFIEWQAEGQQQSAALVLRRYPAPISPSGISNGVDRAARAAAVLKWLSGHDFPTPQVYGAGRDSQGDWLLVSALGGTNWWLPLGLVDFDRVLPGLTAQYVHLLVRLHSLDLSDGPSGDLVPTVTARGMLDQMAQHLKRSIDPDVHNGLERMGDLLTLIEERPARLVHLDWGLENLRVNKQGEICAWVDWDDAVYGDPRWDLGALVNSLGQYQMRDLAKRAVRSYHTESVRPAKHISVWAALVAVLRWMHAAWLLVQIKLNTAQPYPDMERFVNAYDSHKAWAYELLEDAENDPDGFA